jgi:uncharacterized repeat protein (TIGR01451 family)
MNRHVSIDHTDSRMPRLWRMLLVAACTLILCSCQAPVRPPMSGPPGSPALPPQAFTGPPPAGMAGPQVPPAGPPGFELGVPIPYTATGPWAPPGIVKPWPQDEYLTDGGDRGVQVAVTGNRQVRGLEMEDTVACFDTADGRTVVEPSNEVFLYSPRFSAVRQVTGVSESDQAIASSGMHQPIRLVSAGETAIPGSAKQNLSTVRQIGEKKVTVFRTRQGDGAVSTAIGPTGFQNALLPYENFTVIRLGKFEGAEMAWLARGTTAAVTWASDQAVQIMLDHQTASAVVRDEKVDTLFSVDKPPAHPKIRIVKVASTPFAEIGDTVDFTLRFDNVGDQVIGNVVILDSLTTRLEYVERSAQSSLPASFTAQQNEGGSLVLRWEIAQPLEPGKGGILRFTCRVR